MLDLCYLEWLSAVSKGMETEFKRYRIPNHPDRLADLYRYGYTANEASRFYLAYIREQRRIQNGLSF